MAPPPARYDFASDNAAALCPEARQSIIEVDEGYAASYGDDAHTAVAADAIRDLFETDCDVYFVFNGTAANSLALATLCQPYQSVICHELAHLETDECGAPEFFSNGSKVLIVGGDHAQVDPAAVLRTITKRADIHFPKPRALSLTQATEVGTVYPPERIAELARIAHDHDLRVQMDGARFANAVAHLGCAPRAVSWEAGVDVLCLGGTKNGAGLSEAVVFFDRDLSGEFAFRCKQAGQLASKMRYLTAPWASVLRDGAWLRHAAHANEMAALLATELTGIGVDLLHPVEANAVFAKLGLAQTRALRDAGWIVYQFIGGGARFMCSWQTTPASIHEVVACVGAAEAGSR
jgi:threonine aldolase